MALIGMAEAARRMGMSAPAAARLALTNAGITLTKVTARALCVEEDDLTRYLAEHPGPPKRGRPKGAKNKPKE